MKTIVCVLSLFLFTACGFEVVDTGQRGIKVKFGEVIGEALPEGLYFYNPITTSIRELDVREQKFSQKTSAYSKDAQLVEVTYTANIKLEAMKAHVIYKEVGFEWKEKLLRQIFEGTIKEVTGKYTAVNLIESRQKSVDEMRNFIGEKLLEKSIVLISLEVNDFDFDDSFEEAVRRKVIAVEAAKEAKNKTVRIQEEAKQKVIGAKAEAESMTIRAKALTQNKSLVQYEAVQKWDGKLPEYMMGGSTIPFINIKTK